MNFAMRLNIFLRSFFLQTGWNYMKYQNVGLTFVMLPFLKKLYEHDKDALPSVLARYLETFNTQPVMASFCFGALAQKEEAVAHAKTLADFKEKVTEWTAIRRSLSITAASIGDRLFWGALKPLTLLLALFIWLALGVNFFEGCDAQTITPWAAFAAGLTAFLIFNAIALFVKWEGIKISFQQDENACFGLTRFDWNKTIYNAKRLGLLMTAGMLAYGIYYYLKDFKELDAHFYARAAIILVFVCLSFVTRKLKIANMYLYLAAVLAFNIVCLF
uniref:PTS mannose transporter subunit IID n=1 Tax=uncultured Elusimicrobia bacterium TaxID=699876 RepID=A0A650EM99_9BACT|nr:PTS mannose transporter subunit IID [uncultured Elusimicrobia bacterium]